MQNQFLEMNFYKSKNAFSRFKNAFPLIENPFAKLKKRIFFVRIKKPIVLKFIFIKKLYHMNKLCLINFY
jgi:hypothetical protein